MSDPMNDPQNYKADFNDDGSWFVASPDGRRISCGDRRGAALTLACIYEASDPRAEFERLLAEVAPAVESPQLTVHGAYHPRDAGNAAGSDHLVVTADLHSGRLRREAGDALCKPASKFWGLYAHPERKPTCKRCLELAARHGLALPTPKEATDP